MIEPDEAHEGPGVQQTDLWIELDPDLVRRLVNTIDILDCQVQYRRLRRVVEALPGQRSGPNPAQPDP